MHHPDFRVQGLSKSMVKISGQNFNTWEPMHTTYEGRNAYSTCRYVGLFCSLSVKDGSNCSIDMTTDNEQRINKGKGCGGERTVSNLRYYTVPSLDWSDWGNTREIAVTITNRWLRYETWISRLRSVVGNGCIAASTSSREFVPNTDVAVVNQCVYLDSCRYVPSWIAYRPKKLIENIIVPL
jgi:hypothetical protein